MNHCQELVCISLQKKTKKDWAMLQKKQTEYGTDLSLFIHPKARQLALNMAEIEIGALTAEIAIGPLFIS